MAIKSKRYGRIRSLRKNLTLKVKELLFTKKTRDPKSIPIIINNFNRVTFPKMLIDALEERGYRNIYIIDNASTYPPLLEYYASTPYTVFRLTENVGHQSFWKTDIYKRFRNSFYVYTDSDVVPVDECPDDFMAHLLRLLKKYPKAVKAGFGLRLDDIPDHYDKKAEVVEWESQFWEQEIEKDVFKAVIDTTFALYRPNTKPGSMRIRGRYSLRTGGKYTARHMPWYIDSLHLSPEERYYTENSRTNTHWTDKNKELPGNGQ